MRMTVPIMLLALALGCATMRHQMVKDKETLLVAAGFRTRSADDPTRQAQLAAMPPLKMVRRTMSDGSVIYTYADPKGCNCLYFGKQKNYEEYKRLLVNQGVGEEELATSMQADDAALDWGTWSPYGW